MKNILLLPILLITFNSYCQTITFSDNNFKDAIISVGVDTDNNTEISQAEALAITELDVHSKNINNLSGIEFFTNVTDLAIGGNNLSNVNLTALTKLKKLSASGNQLSTVDLSHNLFLEGTDLQSNNLSCLDLSMLTHLIDVHININPISGILDVSKSAGLRIMQAPSCPNLTKICVPVSSVSSAAPGSFVKDAATSWSEACAANEGMTCVITTSTVKFSKGQFNLYPTIFSETFNLEIEEIGTFNIVIIDLTGIVVSSTMVSNKGIHVLGNNLSRGMYILKINGMDKFQTFKIQKN